MVRGSDQIFKNSGQYQNNCHGFSCEEHAVTDIEKLSFENRSRNLTKWFKKNCQYKKNLTFSILMCMMNI